MGQIKHFKEKTAPGEKNKREYPDGFYGATLRNIKGSVRKARLVMDLIGPKSRPAGEFLDLAEASRVVSQCDKRFAYYVDRLLLSAAANAEADDANLSPDDDLVVYRAYADQSRTLDRWRPGAFGRGKPRRKYSCHMTVVLGKKSVVSKGDASQAQLVDTAAGAVASEVAASASDA